MAHKRRRKSSVDCKRRTKLSRLLLPTLPDEVLCAVFMKLSVADWRNAVQVSKKWKRCAEYNAAKFWKARCKDLDLLQSRPDTILGVSVEDVHSRAHLLQKVLSHENLCEVRRHKINTELGRIFNAHYRFWVGHVCASFVPANLDSLCDMCTPPNMCFGCTH